MVTYRYYRPDEWKTYCDVIKKHSWHYALNISPINKKADDATMGASYLDMEYRIGKLLREDTALKYSAFICVGYAAAAHVHGLLATEILSRNRIAALLGPYPSYSEVTAIYDLEGWLRYLSTQAIYGTNYNNFS